MWFWRVRPPARASHIIQKQAVAYTHTSHRTQAARTRAATCNRSRTTTATTRLCAMCGCDQVREFCQTPCVHTRRSRSATDTALTEQMSVLQNHLLPTNYNSTKYTKQCREAKKPPHLTGCSGGPVCVVVFHVSACYAPIVVV